MDRFTAMKSFVEVASRKSFTAAADHLQLSRLQVSRHVKEVEAWLQQRLLHRTTRRVSLTPAGEEALLYSQRILNEMSALEFNAQEQVSTLSGSIRIAAPIAFSGNLLLAAVEKFAQRHPALTLDIIASDNHNELVEDRVDIALRFTKQPDNSLIARKLMNIEVTLCAAPAYLKKQGLPTHPNQLAQHNCFVHLEQYEWDFLDQQQPLKVDVSGNIKANSIEILLRAALHGQGIARLPCDLANPLIEQGVLVPILTDFTYWHYTLWAVYLSRSYQSPKVRCFIDFLVDEFQQDIYL